VLVQIYTDDKRLGCGWRPVLVIESGRKWARVFSPASLDAIQIPVDELRRARPLDVPPTRILRQIRRNRAQARRLGLPDGGKAAKAAVRMLER
jgi:hypothetical protein